MTITYKDTHGIAGMRIAGKLASEVLDYLTPFVKSGVTTNELDKLCHDYIVDVQGAIPAPLNYTGGGDRPYPKSICTSVNHQVCHGIPNDKTLKKGDIVLAGSSYGRHYRHQKRLARRHQPHVCSG